VFRRTASTETRGSQCPATSQRAVPRRTRADPLSRKLGEAIRKAREARGETLDQVAHRIPKMDAKYLGEIERGWHSPTIPTTKRIADALETRLSDLFTGL
jgi:ribosome-binding protein aMBF1 (putative translation factor)